jgi:putative nucleotidyltransferase with HDIG domain
VLDEYTKNWQILIDTLKYPVFVIDTDFNIVMANNAMTEFFNKIDTSQNTKCYQLLHNSDNPIQDCPMLKTIKSGNSEQIDIYVPSLQNTFRALTAPIATAEGKRIGVIHSLIDITDQKESEKNKDDLIEIYAQSINEMKSREIRAQKGRDAFLNMLEDLNESYRELEELFLKFIHVMVNSLDAKSPWTKGHSERVSIYAEQIAMEMQIDADEVKNIKLAGLLHDIGKIGTYDYLLDKPGKLTREEFEIVKEHPSQGARILKEIKQLSEIIPLIEFHHEKLDGNGYPNKLKGELIPLGARILHVADSFDSMTSDRPYRPAPGIDYALSELEKYKGTQFDTKVVEAFVKVLEKHKRDLTNLQNNL